MHVTEAACEALSDMLTRRTGSNECLRLNTHNGGYRFVLDEPVEQDLHFTCEERVVLIVSETISRDLWGVTIDCASENGRRKLVFRKAKAGEPMDMVKDAPETVAPAWKAQEHERLLAEIADIGRQMTALRGTSKSSLREQLHALEAQKQQKWEAIRAIWAGDGQSHRRNGNGVTPSLPAKAAN